jgi:hypothetical protein
MHSLFTRARAEAWRATHRPLPPVPSARQLALAASHQKAETACLTGLCLLLAAAALFH